MKRYAILGLFLGSYAPLFVLLLITQLHNPVAGSFQLWSVNFNVLPVGFGVLSTLGVTYLLSFLHVANSIAPTQIKADKVERHSQETLAYLITYLIPFVGFSFVEVNYLIANVLIFIFIGILYVQSNMIFLNPTLSLFGYKVYKVEYAEHNTLMLAKSHIKPHTTLIAITINKGFIIESRNKSRRPTN